MIGDMDDNGVKFNWSHYDTGDSYTVHVNTSYENDARRKRHLIYRDVGDCFKEILNLESECMEPRFVDWLLKH